MTVIDFGPIFDIFQSSAPSAFSGRATPMHRDRLSRQKICRRGSPLAEIPGDVYGPFCGAAKAGPRSYFYSGTVIRHSCFHLVIVLGLAAGVAIPSTSFPQEFNTPHGGYSVETWDPQSGFHPFSINALDQTPEGYIWLATDGGLVRFDGRDFTEYTTRNLPLFTSNDFTAIAVASDGRLWIGALDGGIWSSTEGGFRAIRRPDDTVRSSEIFSLGASRDGTVWMGDRWGLSRIVDDSIIPVHLPPALEGQVYAITQSPDSTLWFSVGPRVAQLVGRDSVVVRGTLPSPLSVLSLLPSADGGMLIGSNNGLFELRGSTVRKIPGCPMAWIQKLHRDRSGTLWIATADDGLFRYSGGGFEQLTVRDGLPGNRIRTIFEDREGTLWFGTRGGGLFRLKSPAVRVIPAAAGEGYGKISTIYQMRDGTLLIGTRDSGLTVWNGRRSTVLTTRSGIPSDFIRCTMEDARGTLWIGTTGGTVRLPKSGGFPRGGVIEAVRNGVNPIVNVRSIIEDGRGSVWLGTHGNGIFRYQRSTGSISDVTPPLLGYFSLTRILYLLKDGRIIAGSKGGLALVSDSGVVIPENWLRAGISEVFAIHEDDDSTLWIGTYGRGLFRIRGNDVMRATVDEGLFDDVVYAIIEDDRNRLWMSCNTGIFYVDKADLEARAAGSTRPVRSISFGLRDGMSSVECNGGSQPSAWKSRDGRIMFATMGGVAVIDPRLSDPDTIPLRILIDNILVDGSEYPVGGPIELPPESKKIEFNFTAISFHRSADIEFQVLLEGFDEGWVDRGTRRAVAYTSLPHGEYVMRLRARTPEAPWPAESTALPFVVSPHVWERWPVRILLAVSLVAGVVGVMRTRERKIRAEAERNREAQTRITELESRALRSQINPHFLFNSLNGIREAVLGNRTRAASDYLEKFSVLLRNILENSERSTVSLAREIETLRTYIELEQLRFERPFRFSIDVGSGPFLDECVVPPMLIQPVVENAIWHGLSRKEGERMLTIRFSGDGSCVRCTVEDNGIGRAAATAGRAARDPDRKPLGMQITRDRLDILKSRGEHRADVRITDLFHPDGAPAGTRVELIIPVEPP